MNTFINKNAKRADATFFLSDLAGTKVLVQGKKVGKLEDLLITEHQRFPRVTHLIVKRPFGHKSLMVPLERVGEMGTAAIPLAIDNVEEYEGEPAESQVLLKDHILDKKVIDLDGKEVDIVYDIKLLLRNRHLYVTDVDFSRYGLLKRLGLRYVAKFFYHMAEMFKKETISWAYVQPLPERIGSFKGNVKLNVLKEALPDIHPVDMADILEELTEEQRLAIFNELDVEQASDILEEIEPRVQRSLISSMDKGRVADMIDEMTPAQAADVLSVLPASDAEAILELMEHEQAAKIESLLEEQVESVANLTTSNFLSASPDRTVAVEIEEYRRTAPEMDVTNYIYVLDEERKLLGVLNTQELLMADAAKPLEEVMTTQVIHLDAIDHITEAAEMFTRYGFRAIPVVDANDVIQGVLHYRDIMNLEHKSS